MDMQKTNSKLKSKMFLILKIVLLTIVCYFVYKKFNTYWSEVIAYKWTINYGYLIASIVLHLITFVCFSKVWCILIEAFGFKVKLTHAFKISYITSLGRYLPGKLWPVVGMSYLAKQLDISEENAVVSWIVALIFTLPSAFLASMVCILITPDVFMDSLILKLDWTMYLVAVLIFMTSILLVVKPNFIFSLFNILLTKFKRPTINLKITFTTAIQVYLGYFISWLLFGFSFWVFIVSISHGSNIPIIPSIGAFIIAYQIGYLAFFAPGGIGVRELVLTTILSPYLGAVAATISLAARLWNMTAEIISAVIAVRIKFPKKS